MGRKEHFEKRLPFRGQPEEVVMDALKKWDPVKISSLESQKVKDVLHFDPPFLIFFVSLAASRLKTHQIQYIYFMRTLGAFGRRLTVTDAHCHASSFPPSTSQNRRKAISLPVFVISFGEPPKYL